ncbi:MAG: hypothetical protein KIT44_13550 [Opitutaceae bacterium]|nr:hypothetical protein [Opitutaceae bacterium]
MISRKILNATKCTSNRLREIFTERDPSTPNGKIRKKFEERLMARISSGVTNCAKNSKLWQAVDIAWDGTPIQDETIPLLLWAQGKIGKDKLAQDLSKLECASEFVKKEKDKAGNETLKLDLPRLYEVSINLVRMMVTRRLAAQTARFSNLWPYFRYEPRGTDMVSKLRGDALSERIDVMANQYNYRHFFPQTFRHQFMYSRSLVFARCAWDRKITFKVKDTNLPDDRLEFDSFIEREGLDLVAPHVSRCYWDMAAPLPNINTDTGPTYIGYWDIVPYRTLTENSGSYWNLKHVTYGEAIGELLTKYSAFFQHYFDSAVLKWPEAKPDPSAENNRTNNIGRYAGSECGDMGVLLTQHYEKINPVHEGISDKLNCDVWVRLTVAGDNTVIGGEFLTTTPAAYGGLNENDDRIANMSMAMEVMPFQDQLTNLFSQMLMNIKAGMLQIWAIDKDALEPEMQAHIEKTLQAKDYYTQPQAFFYSGAKLRELGVQNPADNPRAFLTIIQANIQTSIENSMKAIRECLDLSDRVLLVSPNERGQPNPREVAAREITEISTTTNSIHTFISDGIDEQRAAIKRMCYESLVCETTQSFRVPVINRYTLATIKEAGFEVKGDWKTDAIIPLKTPIIGKPGALIYDYYFDSRDGADRAVNSDGAKVLAQLLGQFSQSEGIMRAMGRRRLFDMVNEIVRLSGAAFDLKLDEGESEDIPVSAELLQQIVARLEQLEAQLGGRAAQASPLPSPTGGESPAQPPGPPPASQPQEAPPDEAQAGLPPALRSVA